jgi:hypothetical protein
MTDLKKNVKILVTFSGMCRQSTRMEVPVNQHENIHFTMKSGIRIVN